jgi:5-methylcytosine-specific restriction endonuclease McrA
MSGKRVARPRNSGTWTEARFWSFIRSALRGAFNRWGPKYKAKAACKEGRNQYRCSGCNALVGNKDIEIDHKVPAGSLKGYQDLPGFVERLFVEEEGLQALCKTCHKAKTYEERYGKK